jgi:hypothetical protein
VTTALAPVHLAEIITIVCILIAPGQGEVTGPTT